MIENRVLRGYQGEARGRGESDEEDRNSYSQLF
jgi:hypothetical protein